MPPQRELQQGEVDPGVGKVLVEPQGPLEVLLGGLQFAQADFRDRQVWVEEGQMIIVPADTDHKPYAEDVCQVMIIEKASTDHTGGVDDPRRKTEHERI